MARWSGVDPLAEMYAAFSPYNYVMNNPIRYIDPDGMQVGDHDDERSDEFLNGKSISGGLSFGARGEVSVSGAKHEEGDQVDDDYIVNKSGKLINIIKTGEPDRMITQSGEELYFNDSDVDSEELSNYKLGDQMVQFVSDTKLEWIMNFTKAGKNNDGLRKNSYGRYDFVYNDVMKIHFKNEYRIEESGMLRGNRGKFVSVGGFYVFGGRNKYGDRRVSYNIHDAGNFLWGQATKRDGHKLTKLLHGASWNEVLNGRLRGDSNADQRAIINGYGFK